MVEDHLRVDGGKGLGLVFDSVGLVVNLSLKNHGGRILGFGFAGREGNRKGSDE